MFCETVLKLKNQKTKKIKFDKGKRLYQLANNLSTEKHKIELFKIGNTDFTATRIFRFELDNDAKAVIKIRKIHKSFGENKVLKDFDLNLF